MAADYDLQTTHTLVDLATMYNRGTMLDVAKVLHRKDGFLRIAQWEEATGETNHVGAKEVYLGSASTRGPNQGVGTSNPQVENFVESLVRLEIRNEIDEMYADMVDNFDAYRYKRDLMSLEGFRQALFDNVMYGNLTTVDPNKPNGLAKRRNSLSLTAEDGTSIVHNNGGSSSSVQTSIWVIKVGAGYFTMLYPKGRAAQAVEMKDEGRRFRTTSVDSNEGLYTYVTKFVSNYGMAIYQDQAVHRIANVQTNGSKELDIDLLLEVLTLMPEADDLSMTYIICNRTGRHQIHKALRNRPNILYQGPGEWGRPVEYVNGVQLVLTEGITNTEAVVS